MSTQVYSSEMVENLATAFPRRNDNSFAWGNALSCLQNLHMLRCCYPMSSVHEAGHTLDFSEQGRTLTNVGSTSYDIYGLTSYADFNGSTQYLYRTTETGLEITTDLTIGCWTWINTIAGVGTTSKIIAKRSAASAAGSAYFIQAHQAGQQVRFYIANGANYYYATSTNAFDYGGWYFMAGRFTVSTEVAIFLNAEKDTNIVGIPATCNNPGGNFQISGFNGLNELLNGRVTLAFLCQAALSDAQIKAFYWLTRPLFYGS